MGKRQTKSRRKPVTSTLRDRMTLIQAVNRLDGLERRLKKKS
jgi:hypothetical protein